MTSYIRQKERDKIDRRRHFVNFLLVIILGIGSGLLAGAYYVSDYLSSNEVTFSEMELRAENEKIIKDKSNLSVSSLSATEAFVIAEEKLKTIENISMNAQGYIDAAGVKQDIYTKKYRAGSNYFVENISKGKVIMGIDTNIAERNYYDAENDILSVVKGRDITETSATFDSAPRVMSLDDWKKLNGTTPLNFEPYVVSKSSVQKESKLEACTLWDGQSGYHASMSLTKDSAVIYCDQITNLSGLGSKPNISFINLDVYFNADGTFSRIFASEEYVVKKVINVTTVSVLDYYFTYSATPFDMI